MDLVTKHTIRSTVIDKMHHCHNNNNTWHYHPTCIL